MNAGTLQYARVDDALPAEGLQWEDIGDESTLRATMQEFAEDFAASGSGEAGCASPPCSMPPVDE